MQPDTSAGTHHAGSHELRDAPVKYINAILIGVGLLVVLGLVVSWLFVKVADRERAAEQTAISPLAGTLPQQPPEPRLQVHPARDYQEYREAQDAVLHHYALLDEKGEVVRIPIERAMELLLKRGLPVRTDEAAKSAVGKKTK